MSVYKQKLSNRWYIDIYDHNLTRRRLPGFESKRHTENYERKLKDLISCKASGVEPNEDLQRWVNNLPVKSLEKFTKWGLITSQRAYGNRPINELIRDFKLYLKNSGRSAKHIQTLVPRIEAVINGLNVHCIADLCPEKISRYIANLKAQSQRKEQPKEEDKKPLSDQSKKHYIRAMKQFSRWLHLSGRITVDPLARLELPKVLETVKTRRALSLEEIGRLLEAARLNGHKFRGLIGYERYLVYRINLETGLRANEIRTLRAADIGKDTIKVQTKNAKNRKAAVLPIKKELSEIIRDYIRAKSIHPAGQPFGKLTRDTAKMIRFDLKNAGIEYRTDDGDADFHALRHSYCTLLGKSGADLIVSQKLMRHSKSELTANYYTHLYVDDLRTAADRLPDIESFRNRQKKTGTNDTKVYDHNYDYTERQTCISQDKSGLLADVKAETGNPLNGTKNADFEPKTAILQTGGDGIRTHEYRFCKPTPWSTWLRRQK
jgi:integrase